MKTERAEWVGGPHDGGLVDISPNLTVVSTTTWVATPGEPLITSWDVPVVRRDGRTTIEWNLRREADG